MLAVSFAGLVTAGPFEDAGAAFNSGDYATALRLYRSLAEQGDASAQNILGLMYDRGRGLSAGLAAAATATILASRSDSTVICRLLIKWLILAAAVAESRLLKDRLAAHMCNKCP